VCGCSIPCLRVLKPIVWWVVKVLISGQKNRAVELMATPGKQFAILQVMWDETQLKVQPYRQAVAANLPILSMHGMMTFAMQDGRIIDEDLVLPPCCMQSQPTPLMVNQSKTVVLITPASHVS